jgi:hypothetical protein
MNFDSVMDRFNTLAAKIQGQENLNDVNFALIFHETPTKKCSERGMVQRWFAEHNHPIFEWLRP